VEEGGSWINRGNVADFCLDEPRDFINNLSRKIQIISRNFNHGYYDHHHTYALRKAELCYLLVALTWLIFLYEMSLNDSMRT
jgi:hypothetical protein